MYGSMSMCVYEYICVYAYICIYVYVFVYIMHTCK